jgi:hexosaminidase
LKYGDEAFEQLPLERTASKTNRVFPITTWYQGKAIRTANFSYWTHLATGRKVTFQTMPDEKYNYRGELALTDGVVGGTPWRGDQWLGFLNDTVVFTLDLEALTEFKQLEMGMLNEPNSWIYRPQSVRIEISTDGENFKTYSQQQITTDKLIVTKQQTARYIRVSLFNLPLIPEGDPGAGYIPWTFVDELILTR